MGTLSVSFLFPADRSTPSLVAAFSGGVDSRRAAGFPRHLLLLSQGVVSGVLTRSAGVCRGRGKAFLQRRDLVPFDTSECASLLPLRGCDFSGFSVARRN